MKPVIQQEIAGCAIASSAAIAGLSYEEAKQIANALGITADDKELWSGTAHIRKLLNKLGYATSPEELKFEGWDKLPNCALLSIKWHLEKGKPFWHWVVFVREDDKEYVLDSKKALKNNIRTDFGRMKPKWYIEVSS
ncbi:hypothetical protein [Neptuniibacter sp.]|uniref:hypothetical protein n=1 Tax=Neptuniibacter sp. TaxID=1962643 RepID=UPI002611D807|nr:hypothetical protein [Neptuniibacter sp.]MCP4597585.1 hypothetical protein [Neptuniibacter sp.]